MKVTQAAVLNENLSGEAKRLGAALARLRIARGLKQDQAALAKLKNENDAAFDRTYLAEQRNGYTEAVRMVRAYARNGGNPALKELATKTLPILKEHLKLAEALRVPRNMTARR